MPRLLLHSCCAPCSLEPTRLLKEQGLGFELWYGNDNIHPEGEFRARLGALKAYAEAEQIPLTVPVHDPLRWQAAIAGLAGVYPLIDGADDYAHNLAAKKARCRACYHQRFAGLASAARAGGFTAISTTLSISPWQFTGLIEEEIERAAAAYQLEAGFVDWREHYARGQERARELGIYRQNYCGCAYSQQEAELERAAARERRRQKKAERQASRGQLADGRQASRGQLADGRQASNGQPAEQPAAPAPGTSPASCQPVSSDQPAERQASR
ncbi:MAG: epoxyqueuosine reductase QueH [Coriobacteriia bacterium]|nr:epoxyqueuosine reductase QueH [Coriobacteriia bacterium]